MRRFLRRVRSLARAEVLHVVRDRTTMAQIIIMPLVQLLILSNAATFQIRNTPMTVVDLDRTMTSRGLIQRFVASGHFDVDTRMTSPAQANEALVRGTATMVLTIPDNFEESLVRTRQGSVQIDLNAEKGSAAGVVQSYTSQILAAYGRDVGTELRPTTGSVRAWMAEPPPIPGVPRIDTRYQNWFNPTLNYKHYMVPGILVALVTMIGTLLTAQNIAREKEIGTLEQLNVTPISRAQFITAKLLPYWMLALLDLSLGLVVAKLVFHVPMEGSLVLLFGCAAVYLVVALGIGLWISTIVETQQQAMFVSFFVMMIYLLMSGLFTPIDSMPHWVQVASQFNPVRHFVTVARAILIKGAGLAEVAKPMLILVVFGAVVLTLAIRQHSKRTA